MMKRPIVLLALLWWLTLAVFAADPERVLFIGNSYTGVNNLPGVFAEVVKSTQGRIPEIKSHTPGGQTLIQHLNLQPKTLALIDEGRWDVVVLQGQSQEAAYAEVSAAVRDDFIKGAAGLCNRIRVASPKARIVFYETWARHADFWNSPANSPVVAMVGKSPAEMQARNRRSYDQVASANNAVVAHVGEAWSRNYLLSEPIRLHAADNSHPTPSGTYLAALVLYRTIYQPRDVAVPYIGKLSADEAKKLQALVQAERF